MRLRDTTRQWRTPFKKRIPNTQEPENDIACFSTETSTSEPSLNWSSGGSLQTVAERIEAEIEALEAQKDPSFIAGEDEARHRIESLLAGRQGNISRNQNLPSPAKYYGSKGVVNGLPRKHRRFASLGIPSLYSVEEQRKMSSTVSDSKNSTLFQAGQGIRTLPREDSGLPGKPSSSQTGWSSVDLHRMHSPGPQLRTRSSRGSMISVKSHVSLSYRTASGHTQRLQHRSLSELEFRESGFEIRQKTGPWTPKEDLPSSDDGLGEGRRITPISLPTRGSEKSPQHSAPQTDPFPSPHPSEHTAKALQDLASTERQIQGSLSPAESNPRAQTRRTKRAINTRGLSKITTTRTGPSLEDQRDCGRGRVRVSLSCPELKVISEHGSNRLRASLKADPNPAGGLKQITQFDNKVREETTIGKSQFAQQGFDKIATERNLESDNRVNDLENKFVRLRWRCVKTPLQASNEVKALTVFD